MSPSWILQNLMISKLVAPIFWHLCATILNPTKSHIWTSPSWILWYFVSSKMAVPGAASRRATKDFLWQPLRCHNAHFGKPWSKEFFIAQHSPLSSILLLSILSTSPFSNPGNGERSSGGELSEDVGSPCQSAAWGLSLSWPQGGPAPTGWVIEKIWREVAKGNWTSPKCNKITPWLMFHSLLPM